VPFGDGGIAQHIDIAPTVAAATRADTVTEWVGTPLQTQSSGKDGRVCFQLSDMRGLTADGWRFIDCGGRHELWRLDADWTEREEVSNEYTDRLEGMRDRTDSYFAGRVTDRYSARSRDITDRELSETVRENLDDLGYI